MWPFKKKAFSPAQLPVDGPWLVSEGKHNGNPMFVRTNTGYGEFTRVPGYDHHVGIAIPLRESTINGLPGEAESILLSEMEDTFCVSLEEQAAALLVAVITTSGMREFVFYTNNPGVIEQRVTKLRKQITSHEIQLVIQPDREWRVYSRFQQE
jgi:hypothetical protein